MGNLLERRIEFQSELRRLRLSVPCRVAILTAMLGVLGHNELHAAGPIFTDLTASYENARIAGTNPAGMVQLDEPVWRASLVAAFSQSTWELSSTGLDRSSSSDSRGSGYVPSLFYVRPINSRWTVGGSLSAVGGFGDSADDQAISRYLAKKWSVGSYGLQSSAAYRFNERWSIGFGVGVNVTVFDWEAAVFNGAGQADGTVELEDDDIELSYVLGAHWAPSPRTRLGFSWRSEYGPKIAGRPVYTNVDPGRQLDSEVRLDVTFPQNVLGGVHHTLENGHWISLDVLWAQTSKFDIQSAVVDESGRLNKSSLELRDAWAISAGWGMPIDSRWSIGLGALYLDELIDDENRSVLLRVDSIWGIGASVEYASDGGKVIGANFSWLDTGEAPVSTRALPIVGVISGRYSSRSAILVEVYVQW